MSLPGREDRSAPQNGGYAPDGDGRHPARPDLKAYLDGEMAGWSRRRVRRHLAACAGCSREARWLRRVSDSLRTLDTASPPEGLRDRIRADVIPLLAATRRPVPAQAARPALAAASLVLACCLVAILGAFALDLLNGPGSQPFRTIRMPPVVMEAAPAEVAQSAASPTVTSRTSPGRTGSRARRNRHAWARPRGAGAGVAVAATGGSGPASETTGPDRRAQGTGREQEQALPALVRVDLVVSPNPDVVTKLRSIARSLGGTCAVLRAPKQLAVVPSPLTPLPRPGTTGAQVRAGAVTGVSMVVPAARGHMLLGAVSKLGPASIVPIAIALSQPGLPAPGPWSARPPAVPVRKGPGAIGGGPDAAGTRASATASRRTITVIVEFHARAGAPAGR